MMILVWFLLAGLLVVHVRRRQIRAWWRRITSRMLTGATPLLLLQAGMLWAADATGTSVSAAALFLLPTALLVTLQVTR